MSKRKGEKIMKAAMKFDLTAKTAEKLIEEFDIKVSNSNVLFWEKPAENNREADISLPKQFFREEVLKKLEKNYS